MNNINASTRLTGIIGWPVEHSLSPVMHNAAFEALGLNWCYAAFPVPPELLGDAVQGLRALGIAGANVTIPHKEAVIPFLDVLSPAARAVGAVNTISVDGEYLLGDNTDVHGFLAALDRADVPLHGRRALVLGAGGSARAAVYGLLLRGAEVIIHARTPARARRLADDMRAVVEGGRVEAVEHAPAEVDLVVNCTPVGMWPHHDGESPLPANVQLRPSMAVMDLVYRPLETVLLRQARLAGARAVSGLEMLVWQGVVAFEHWTGREAPVEVMRQACLRALGEA
ncbi:MAG: shikimate dehydrogenase [Anaerolineae bacterium]